MPPCLYDAILVLDVPEQHFVSVRKSTDVSCSASAYILNLLQYGLSSRIKGICEIQRPVSSSLFVFGIVFDPDQVFRLIDKGPNPSLKKKEAESFRAFWGASKSELRKFSNTGVVECVVWDVPEVRENRSRVLFLVIAHILEMHLRLSSLSIRLLGLELLPLAEILSQPVSKTDGTSLLQSAFGTLKSALMSFESVLSIHSIQPLSSSVRGIVYADAPLISTPADYFKRSETNHMVRQAPVPVHSVLITFESSSRWPTEPKAFMAMLTAFLGNIGAFLQRSKFPTFVSVNGSGPSFMDVLVDGFVFRCYIDHGFAFPQLTRDSCLSLQNPSATLIPDEDLPQNSRVHVHLWQEKAVRFTESPKSWIMNKSNEFKFYVFSEALNHSLFVNNSIYSHHPKPIIDGIKLLAIWASMKKLSGCIPIEAIESLVVKASCGTNSNDETISDTSLAQESYFDSNGKPKHYVHDEQSPASSPHVAFLKALQFIASSSMDQLQSFGLSSPDVVAELASQSLSVFLSLSKKAESETDINAFSETSLLAMFRAPADRFDFLIKFESGRFLSDIRLSIADSCRDLSQDDLLASFVMPGFIPLQVLSDTIEVKFIFHV